MRRVKPVFTAWLQRNKRRSWHAGATGVALWLCLTTTSAGANPSCTVSTPGLAFGVYDVYAAGVTNGSGTLSVKCDLNPPPGNARVNYTISLATGSSNSFVQRQMKSVGNSAYTFAYNLYTTNGYSVVWGDGTGSTATIAGSMRLRGSNPSQTNMHTVYGQIPALQDVAVANDYKDNVTVTVTY